MKLKLHWQIIIAIFLSVLFWLATDRDSVVLGISTYAIVHFIGEFFLNALKMLIVPLIVSSVITGIASVGGQGGFGRLGAKTLIYYLVTSLIAILIGLTLVNLIQPGVGDEPIVNQNDAALIADKVGDKGTDDVVSIFLRMVPPNIVQAAADGQMIGLIVFSILFGYFMTRLEPPYKETMAHFWDGAFQVMMQMTHLIMKLAPIGVFALVAKTLIDSEGRLAEELTQLMLFVVTTLTALAIHMFIVMPLILSFIGRVNPLKHYQAMAPALLTAFSTASSSATLPLTMDCVEKNAGVSNRTSSFVLPLGATVNMDGTALYECVAAMYIAQKYGLELSVAQQFLIVSIALLTSIGVAGVPAASLVAITIILGAIGLPLEAIALIYAVDRILDMCRTSVNVFGDSCGAVVIARTEGENPLRG